VIDLKNIQWHELKCGDSVEILKTIDSARLLVTVLSFRKVMAIVKCEDGQLELFDPAEFNDFYRARKIDLKPRTKTECVKCDFTKLSNVFAEHEITPLYDYQDADTAKILTDDRILKRFKSGAPFFRKVETEIAWQDEAAALNSNLIIADGLVGMTPVSDADFIELCHLVSSMNK
jgi:hypothetical protein